MNGVGPAASGSPGALPDERFSPENLRRSAAELDERIARGEKNPDSLLEAAAMARMLDRHDDALRHVDSALRLAPGARGYLLRAEIMADSGELAASARAVAIAAKLEPTAACLCRGGAILETSDAFDAALLLLERAARLDPASVEARVQLARLLLWHGRFAAARAHAERAAALDPLRCEPARQQVAACLLEGKFARALALSDAALPRLGQDHEAWTLRGEALRRARRYDEAKAALRRARELCPQNLGAELNEVLVKLARGEPLSRHEIMTAIGQVPPGLYEDLNISAEEARDGRSLRRIVERALDALQGNRSWTPTFLWSETGRKRVVRHIRYYPRGCMVQVQARVRFGDYRLVLSQFDAIIRAAPEEGYPHSHRGEVRLWVGQYAGAKKDFSRSRELAPELLWPKVGLVAVALFQNRLDEAELALAKLDASESILLPWSVELHRRRSRHLEALAMAEKLQEPVPFRPHVWMNRALAHVALGQQAAAAELHAAFLRHVPEFCADIRAAGRLGSGSGLRTLKRLGTFFETGLAAMRGNRSRWMYTYFLPDGQMKTIRIQGIPRESIPVQLQAYSALYGD